MTEEQMQELLEAAKPAVIESLKNELKAGISYEARNKCGEIVREHVEDWVRENIIPEISKALIESKKGMISVGASLGDAIVSEVQKAAIQSVKKNLEQSWQRKKIFAALLS